MKKLALPLLLIIAFLSSCKDDNDNSCNYATVDSDFTQSEIEYQSILINPTGFSPLSARVELNTSDSTRVQIRVIGRQGAESDVISPLSELGKAHEIMVLGLYAGYSNELELTLFDAQGNNLGSSIAQITTVAIHQDMPTIDINNYSSSLAEGMSLVSYFGPERPFKPFIFDRFGDIRWYLDYSSHPKFAQLHYDCGIERLQNGNLYFGNIGTGAIYEVDMYGNIISEWHMPGHDFHHNVYEKPNGNFIVSTSKQGISTVEDFIIEIDRNSGGIINEWDLRQSLQQDRRTLTQDSADWVHVNALIYDERDNTIIASGRTQGVFKLDQNNNVIWILNPHKDWGLSGNGVDLTSKLLQPLDASGTSITDTAVLNGYSQHPDFDWPWYQHAPKITPEGRLLIFDNGYLRNYDTLTEYSRAVEYEIDENNMTIQQTWEYGKDRGQETYSFIVSDVDYLESMDHVVFSPGAIGGYGKMVEIDYASGNVIYEATITMPGGFLAFHRTDRVSLYP